MRAAFCVALWCLSTSAMADTISFDADVVGQPPTGGVLWCDGAARRSATARTRIWRTGTPSSAFTRLRGYTDGQRIAALRIERRRG